MLPTRHDDDGDMFSKHIFASSVGAVEYTDCFSAE